MQPLEVFAFSFNSYGTIARRRGIMQFMQLIIGNTIYMWSHCDGLLYFGGVSQMDRYKEQLFPLNEML